ncbi:lipoxygenase [Podospora aff. communis PSN243]|uniref:Manganese lipoxygenase n=1 Tax=Podospora aff. communis PSN243 TaxID=3040156 RepID=A0AAV9GSL8_9PEZI|nr:lipoxygenase [Podospora aff. communis PSN243]
MLLPIFDNEPDQRVREIQRKREGYLYGRSLLGNTSHYPEGLLGDAMSMEHQQRWYEEAQTLKDAVYGEAGMAYMAVAQAGGIQQLSDYQKLYDNQWLTSAPDGVSEGYLANFTSDLLFSMERLSANPYSVHRLHPTASPLPFDVDEDIVATLTGWNLRTLHRNGHLFFVDHSYQSRYPTAEGKYTDATMAYFYIHPRTSEFLPLAIKTMADLVYTPLDRPNEWLLAKAMFNQNDLFAGQILHLANSHAVGEIVHLAALRTMSDKHPVMALLHRLMHQVYAVRPIANLILFNSTDGLFDQSFAITNLGVRQFATEFYPSAGRFQSNYFYSDLLSRGLLNCTYGPPLKHFPFFSDASTIHTSIRRFVASFVHAYYPSPRFLALDHELQSWIAEATLHAGVLDFPASPLTSHAVLIDILSHLAYLNSVSHNVLNGAELFQVSGTLPLHPAALYHPPPTTKGAHDINIMKYLPPLQESIQHVSLVAFFGPTFSDKERMLVDMFAGEEVFGRGSLEGVRVAARRFKREMMAFSKEVQGRRLDAGGMWGGMPFVWRALDPVGVPYFLNV